MINDTIAAYNSQPACAISIGVVDNGEGNFTISPITLAGTIGPNSWMWNFNGKVFQRSTAFDTTLKQGSYVIKLTATGPSCGGRFRQTILQLFIVHQIMIVHRMKLMTIQILRV